MTVKTSEPKISTEGTTKHVSSENAKMPQVVSGAARRKRGPAGRETTHPIAVSFQRSTPQSIQSSILNGQSTQIAAQKLAGNVIDCLVPRQSGLNTPDASSKSEISAKVAPKVVQAMTDVPPKS
ncbi:hypothetical protein MMC31_003123 [Peltigera leucophlebia]|nr:hypothetical protein [Peltigera leucophlebia]